MKTIVCKINPVSDAADFTQCNLAAGNISRMIDKRAPTAFDNSTKGNF
jgi:hypothetical protein